ncbi:HPr kinase/phosphorylase [Sphingomicrobium nitratireducens]|uniref:HPr kinase/phosphorylase n=1 Tax=Sphingomicrobium nitratireducens TaxID=2964666 RepID=UPI00224048B2|nr:aldolase [Sphingomicrobium nitratireducens]
MSKLSTENIHATTVARGDRAVVIGGPSGAGKSDLALQLIDRGYKLVADDQTLLRRDKDRLFASAPPSISGKMEVRGLGIIELASREDVMVALYVDLSAPPDRLPEEGEREMLFGCALPRLRVDPKGTSAAIKIDMALDRIGLEP